jgi:hypothetical protein
MNSGGKERMDDSGDEDLPSFGLIASLAVDEGEIDRVLKVFPNQGLSREKIRQDLRRSGSAGATINRILDNQISWEEAGNVDQNSRSEAIQITYGNVEIAAKSQTSGTRLSETLGSTNCFSARGSSPVLLSSENCLPAVSAENQDSDSDSSICIIEEVPLAKRLNTKSCSGYSSEVVPRSSHGGQLTDCFSNIGGTLHNNGVVGACSDDSDISDLWLVNKSSQEGSGCRFQATTSSGCSDCRSQATTSSGWSQSVDSQETEGSGKSRRPRQKLTEEERERRVQERLVCVNYAPQYWFWLYFH